jgi:hypothetical protein
LFSVRIGLIFFLLCFLEFILEGASPKYGQNALRDYWKEGRKKREKKEGMEQVRKCTYLARLPECYLWE